MADDGGKMMGDAGRGTECESEGWRNGKPVETKIRTTEEKRQILGSMFGNVDALVEGVRKAGIWGLG